MAIAAALTLSSAAARAVRPGGATTQGHGAGVRSVLAKLIPAKKVRVHPSDRLPRTRGETVFWGTVGTLAVASGVLFADALGAFGKEHQTGVTVTGGQVQHGVSRGIRTTSYILEGRDANGTPRAWQTNEHGFKSLRPGATYEVKVHDRLFMIDTIRQAGPAAHD